MILSYSLAIFILQKEIQKNLSNKNSKKGFQNSSQILKIRKEENFSKAHSNSKKKSQKKKAGGVKKKFHKLQNSNQIFKS